MSSSERPLTPERSQTDESLRNERAKADDAIGEGPGPAAKTADAVVIKARARADEVLADERAKTDERAANSPPSSRGPNAIQSERLIEDQAVEKERTDADEILRVERAEQAALLELERGETDKDLSRERARSDHAVATRDEFLSIVSHDLRNMLNSVMGFAALIAKGLPGDNEREQSHALRILRSGKRMDRLIGDLVDVASIEAGMLAVRREILDPAQVVTEAVDTFLAQASACEVSLSVEIVPVPRLAFDPARILQVLTNFLSNALKFTPKQGKVVVKLEQIGDEVCITVSDTGPGIAAEKLEAVFQRFLQITHNDRRGVGLGLYISKCIVEGHGGRIWAEARAGGGSTFAFTLPLRAAG